MAAFLDFKDLAHRISTAGLEPDQTSVKGLGRDYEFAELLLTGLELGLELDELVRHIQVTDYGSQQIEKYFQLYQSPNHASTEALVADVLKRHQIALRKAAIVNPEIAPISLHYE